MFDLGILAFSMFLIFVVCNRRFRFQVGKFKPVEADARYKFLFVFPLGTILAIIAVLRMLGHFNPDRCLNCSQVSYDLIGTIYVGWVLSIYGLFGVRSFRKIKHRAVRAFVVVAIICGPFLMGLGLHDLAVLLRS